MGAARKLPAADFGALPYGDDPWRLSADRAALALARTPPAFVIGNGVIGIRGPGVDEHDPKIYLNGVYERVPIPYHEAAHGYARDSDTRLAVADPARIAVLIDGMGFATWDRAELDFRRGTLVLLAERGGVRIALERLVTMDGNVIATRVTIKADRPLTVAAKPGVLAPPGRVIAPASDEPYDPRIGPGFAASPWNEIASESDGRADRLAGSGFVVAAAVQGDDAVATMAAGETRVYDSFATISARRDVDGAALLAEVRASCAAAAAAGFDALAERQRDWFARFWADADIALPDAPRAEQALHHALFQLVQAAGPDGARSVAAKGQTGEGYEGHVFWDAETYILPVLARIAPDAARGMLAWRIARLEEARANARAMGQARGALFPWRTIGGRECSSFFPAGSAQYHINADVAHALELYIAATGDTSLLAEGGAEMLVETARIWLEIGFHDPARGGAFVINRVTGPDEYSALVDNNLYTNLMAARHLRFAASTGGDHLDPGEAEAMERAAAAMLLPHDTARDIPAQDDGFFAREPWPFAATPGDRYPLLIHYHPLTLYRHRIAKQADAILACALLPDSFDHDMRARMLDAYEAVTVHDSTLSASAFAVAAARIGDRDRAWDYWRMTVLTDLGDLFDNSGHGLHMAALAGGWTALVSGFAGLAPGGDLRFDPIALPALGRYAFTLRHHGRRLRVSVDADTVRYALEEGAAITLGHRDETLTLAPGTDIVRPLA